MQTPTPKRTLRRGKVPGKVHWWLRLTSWGWNKPQETIEQREKTRRSVLLAWILLGIFIALLVFIPTGFTYPPAMISVITAAFMLIIALWLNRIGLVTIAGATLVAITCIATFGVVLASPDRTIHLYFLPAYDFLVVSVILGASILPRISAFIVAALDIIAIYLDLLFQPQAADLQAAIHTYSLAAVTARPVVLLLITAVIAYLWVRSMDQAVQRADRAEELHALEQYLNQVETEHTARVKEFVQEVINAMGALANGQEGLLLLPPHHPWQQQATFINTQLKQFHKLKQANRGNNEQLLFAAETLLRLLQRVNTGQSPVSELDPRHFTTHLAVTDEITRQIYSLFLLQEKQAFRQQTNHSLPSLPRQPAQE
ncbi:MAG TPA: hypothetical protein VGM01_01325 [Ktedonobacteraceae bacterium]